MCTSVCETVRPTRASPARVASSTRWSISRSEQWAFFLALPCETVVHLVGGDELHAVATVCSRFESDAAWREAQQTRMPLILAYAGPTLVEPGTGSLNLKKNSVLLCRIGPVSG